MAVKKFVPVITKFEENGKITPLKILWEDGRALSLTLSLISGLDRLLKLGGQRTRYLCRIKNKDVYVYYEKQRWYVEGKEH